MGRALIALGSLFALTIGGFVTIYLVQYALSGRPTTTLDIVAAVAMAVAAAGAVVVLFRLYRNQPVGWVAAYVLLVGLGLPALLAVLAAFGVPFVLDY